MSPVGGASQVRPPLLGHGHVKSGEGVCLHELRKLQLALAAQRIDKGDQAIADFQNGDEMSKPSQSNTHQRWQRNGWGEGMSEVELGRKTP